MKKACSFILLLYFFVIFGCSYKPLYKKKHKYSDYKIQIIVKAKGKYENNAPLLKNLLNEKLNFQAKKNSSIKLVISIERTISDLGYSKDLYSYGKKIEYFFNYTLYDKIGQLDTGSMSNQSTYNFTSNTYANIVSEEDSSEKLIKNFSNNLTNILLSKRFSRKIEP